MSLEPIREESQPISSQTPWKTANIKKTAPKFKKEDSSTRIFSSIKEKQNQTANVSLISETMNVEDWEDNIDPAGRFDEYDFGKYGKEKCERIETVDINGKMQLKKIAHLKKELKLAVAGLGLDKSTIKELLNKDADTILLALKNQRLIQNLTPAEKEKIAKIEKQLRFAREMLRNVKVHKQTAESPTFLASGEMREKMLEHGFHEAHFTPSVPTNLRVQRFEGPEDLETTNIDFVKMGAHYDPKDPGNSIPQIEKYLSKFPDTRELDAEIKKREAKARKFLKNKKYLKAEGVRASIRPLQMVKEGKIDEVHQYIENKKLYLNDQMALYVLTQVDLKKDKLERMKNGAEFTLTHLSFLNETKDEVHESGMVHNEATLIEEMSANFSRFKGKKVIFDGRGPLIDIHGNIHSPTKIEEGNNRYKHLVLKPRLVNLTVQGYTKNGPIQRTLNEGFISDLIQNISQIQPTDEKDLEILENAKKTLVDIHENLWKGHSDFRMACNLFSELIKIKKIKDKYAKDELFAISAGCYSAKDRTGIVSDVSLSMTGLKDAIDALEEDPKTRKNVLHNFARKILRRRLATKTALDNVGKRMIKVSTFFIPLITDDIKGAADRSVFLVEQVWDLFEGSAKKFIK